MQICNASRISCLHCGSAAGNAYVFAFCVTLQQQQQQRRQQHKECRSEMCEEAAAFIAISGDFLVVDASMVAVLPAMPTSCSLHSETGKESMYCCVRHDQSLHCSCAACNAQVFALFVTLQQQQQQQQQRMQI
jgi:preprotein translocase subunit YajC